METTDGMPSDKWQYIPDISRETHSRCMSPSWSDEKGNHCGNEEVERTIIIWTKITTKKTGGINSG